jgi:hypothetical protein
MAERSLCLTQAIAGYDEANRFDHGKDLAGAPKRSGTVRLLVQHGAPLAVSDRKGMTALHAAVRARWARAVQLIVGTGAAPVLLETRSGGTDPRHSNQTALVMVCAGLRRALMLAATTSIKLVPPPPTLASEDKRRRHNALKSWGLAPQPPSGALCAR